MPLERFFHFFNQLIVVLFICVILTLYTQTFGSETHTIGITVMQVWAFFAILPVITYFGEKFQSAAMKKCNAFSHLLLMVATYCALIYDNTIYFTDKERYCEAGTKTEACNSRMFGLWMLDIFLFVGFLTWLSCCRAVNRYA